LIGVGIMGESTLKGLLKGGLTPEDFVFIERIPERTEAIARTYGLEKASDLPGLVRRARYILLCVKPKDVGEVVATIGPILEEGQVVISIVAGLETNILEKMLGNEARVVRLMPNLPVSLGEGTVGLVFGDQLGEQLKGEIRSLFAPLGRLVEVSEDLMDVLMAVSGCGPAFICLFLEGLIDGGVMLGLAREKARALALQTMVGTVRLLEAENLDPAVLKGLVESPGGATIAGAAVLDDRAVRGSIARAIEAAVKRTKELRK
jgi:pyrroline-5-carboxylate reductase